MILGLYLTLRVALYETYAAVTAVVWWGSVAVFAWLFWSAWSAFSVFIAVAGVLGYRPFASAMRAQRHRLIRPGDRVEFAEPTPGEELTGGFSHARVLRRLERETVRRSGAFGNEELDAYDSVFFTVDTGSVNRIIPYEWIIALEGADVDEV